MKQLAKKFKIIILLLLGFIAGLFGLERADIIQFPTFDPLLDDWYNNGVDTFLYAKKLTTQDADFDSTFTNYVVLVNMTTEDIGTVTQSDCDDVVFTNWYNDTKLNFELERCDPTNNILIAHVLLPNAYTNGTNFMIFFGDSDSTTYQESTQATWPSTHKYVGHLNGTFIDSSTTPITCTDASTAAKSNEYIGSSRTWNNLTSSIDCGSDSKIDNIFDGGGSVGFWIKPKSDGLVSPSDILDKGFNGDTTGWTILTSGETGSDLSITFNNEATTDGVWITTADEIQENVWNFITVTWDDDTPTTDPIIYVDGTAVGVTESAAPSSYTSDGTNDICLGAGLGTASTCGTSRVQDGEIDEIRFIDFVVTADYVKADWECQKISGCITFGTTGTEPGGGDTSQVTNLQIINVGWGNSLTFNRPTDGIHNDVGKVERRVCGANTQYATVRIMNNTGNVTNWTDYTAKPHQCYEYRVAYVDATQPRGNGVDQCSNCGSWSSNVTATNTGTTITFNIRDSLGNPINVGYVTQSNETTKHAHPISKALSSGSATFTGLHLHQNLTAIAKINGVNYTVAELINFRAFNATTQNYNWNTNLKRIDCPNDGTDSGDFLVIPNMTQPHTFGTVTASCNGSNQISIGIDYKPAPDIGGFNYAVYMPPGNINHTNLQTIKTRHVGMPLIPALNPASGVDADGVWPHTCPLPIGTTHYSQAYADEIQDYREVGAKPIGYVATGYKNSSGQWLAHANWNGTEIQFHIMSWANCYADASQGAGNGVMGVMLDEMINTDNNERRNWYRDLCDMARTHIGIDVECTTNPGSDIPNGSADDWHTTSNALKVYESGGLPPLTATLFDAADTKLNYNRNNWAIIAHTVTSAGNLCDGRNPTWEGDVYNYTRYAIYTQDGNDGNPWNSLSCYLGYLAEASSRPIFKANFTEPVVIEFLDTANWSAVSSLTANGSSIGLTGASPYVVSNDVQIGKGNQTRHMDYVITVTQISGGSQQSEGVPTFNCCNIFGLGDLFHKINNLLSYMIIKFQ